MTDEEQKAPFDAQEERRARPPATRRSTNKSPPAAESRSDGPSERDLPEGKYKGGVVGGESEADPVTDVGEDAPTPTSS